MASRPSFLGRGRGRGQKDQKSKISGVAGAAKLSNDYPKTAWGQPTRQTPASKTGNGITSNGSGVVKHADAAIHIDRYAKVEEIRQSAAKFTSGSDTFLDSSDSDDDVNDDEILSSTLKTYQGEGDEGSLSKVKQYLQESCSSRALTCLICIASVKHNDAIWNCSQCYSILHLQCIQKWSNDGAVPNLPLSQDVFPDQEMKWFCPKCRYEYGQLDRPTKYICFCGKTVNPTFDPWTVPHSCGERCDRELTPHCGHNCLLLCHPGPCPPCPKMVQARCHCGSQAPTTRRCSSKQWSCGKRCGKLLVCGHHKCKTNCHAGICPACPEQSTQYCRCGRNKSIRPCDQPNWLCTEVCGKLLECGSHRCADVCHGGPCSSCPRSGKRTCPCGKTTYYDLVCTEDVPVCGDTCDLILSCGRHNCTMRCHSGPCETCRQVVTKICNCGKKEKSVQCSKDFTCDMKCTKLKNCERHQCRKKCCNNQCQACEQICGRQLSCKNHKCPSVCHRGFCYPCPLTRDVECNCGATKISVPCGRERVTKPPKCSQLCKAPSDCHHKERKPHRCHFGKCPSCKEICGKKLTMCNHTCQIQCHDNVVRKQKALAFPGKADLEEKPSMVADCPPCTAPVMRSCFGDHETVSLPCFHDGPFMCGRPCGRFLSCTNHTCQLECHEVTAAPSSDKSGVECEKCELPCSKPRPSGCFHECLRKCHSDACGECKKMVKQQCHCGAMFLYIKCCELTTADEHTKAELISCKGTCPMSLRCGHNCSMPCHPGPCIDSRECTKKTTRRCPCKRIKKEFQCCDAQHASVDCNDDCKKLKTKTEKEKKDLERIQREEEMKLQQEEVEKFERKKQGKKRRSRKHQEEIVEPSWLSQNKNVIIFATLALVFVAFIVHIAVTE